MNLSTDLTDWDFMDYFLPMFIIGIGVALLVTGLFTSYFGAGKSQKIGFALLFFGIGKALIEKEINKIIENIILIKIFIFLLEKNIKN